MARFLRLIVTFLPLQMLVRYPARLFTTKRLGLRISVELASVPEIQAGLCEEID